MESERVVLVNYHFISRLAERYNIFINREQYNAILYGAEESVPLLVEPNGEEWHRVYYKGTWLYVLLRYDPRRGNELATVITKIDMDKKLALVRERKVLG